MRVLLIGAGAVGQVYGHHFQRGGAEVSFYVRDKYAAEVRRGFALYPMNRKKPRAAAVRFEGFEVLTDMAAVGAQAWDVVVICVSSTALRKGDWFAKLAAGLGDATLLNLTPGIEDYALVTGLVPAEQVVSGLIGFMSYPGPLEGAALPTPGMVYWLPPRAKLAFSGPQERTTAIVDTLTSGGLKSKRVPDVQASAAFAGPLLQFLIVALELSGWRFAALRADKALMKLAYGAMREAQAVASARLDTSVPFAIRRANPWVQRLLTRVLARITPFDVERFFKKHFLKVGDQTEHGLQTLIRLAAEHGTPSDAMGELLGRLRTHRSSK